MLDTMVSASAALLALLSFVDSVVDRGNGGGGGGGRGRTLFANKEEDGGGGGGGGDIEELEEVEASTRAVAMAVTSIIVVVKA